jgi:hypothetical protein
MNHADLHQQATGLGLSSADLARLIGTRPAPEQVAVQPPNWPAVRVFLAAETQWLRAGMEGVPTALNLAAIPAVAGMLDIPANADLLARLRVLEGEALVAMAEKAR